MACRGLCELALPVFFSSFTTVCFLLGCVPATEIFLISRLGKLVLLAGPPSPGQALFPPWACGWLLTIWALAWAVAQKSLPSLPCLRWTRRPPCLEFLFHSLRHCLWWSFACALLSFCSLRQKPVYFVHQRPSMPRVVWGAFLKAGSERTGELSASGRSSEAWGELEKSAVSILENREEQEVWEERRGDQARTVTGRPGWARCRVALRGPWRGWPCCG